MTDTMLLVVGVVLVAVSIPLILRRIPPNRWYGLRVPATFADEYVWYEANAKSGRDLLIFGLIPILLALRPPVVGELSEWASAAVLVAGGLAIAVGGWRRAN